MHLHKGLIQFLKEIRISEFRIFPACRDKPEGFSYISLVKIEQMLTYVKSYLGKMHLIYKDQSSYFLKLWESFKSKVLRICYLVLFVKIHSLITVSKKSHKRPNIFFICTSRNGIIVPKNVISYIKIFTFPPMTA